MTLTGLAVSRLVGMMGPRVSAFLKNLEENKPRILDGGFDDSERLVGAKGYSAGLMQ
jgi:hypothetical protein